MTPARCRLLLLVAVLLVFGQTVLFDFTWWDDQGTVHQNPSLNPVTLDSFVGQWQHPTAKIYIPLTYTVWSLLTFVARVPADQFGVSLNPLFYHATNVLVHAGGALAAFALLRRLARNDVAALVGAAFWALHPVQVEPVAWVSGLKDVLSGTLVLVALATFAAYRQDGGRWRYGLALVLYALAMLAKPAAFTTPLLVVVLDVLVFRTPWKRVASAVLPMAVLAVPIAVVARLAQPPLPLDPIDAWQRPLVAGDALAFYLVRIVAPVHLAIDYGRTIAAIRAGGQLWYAWLLPAAAAALLAAAYAVRRTGPLPLVAGLWFVLAPVTVLGLTAFDFEIISTVADHYLYVALIGPALLLAWLVAERPRWAAIAGVLVGLYAARAVWQAVVWQNSQTLFDHTLAINPASWATHNNRAALYGRLGDADAERRDLEASEALGTVDPTAELGLMDLSLRQSRYADADRHARALIADYERFWNDRGPLTAPAFETVAGVYLAYDRGDDAARYVSEGLARSPTDRVLLRFRQQIEWARAGATTAP